MATKSKATPDAATAPAAPPAIPAMNRGAALLKKMAGKPAATAPKKGTDRIVITSPEIESALRTWVPAKMAFDRFESHAKSAGDELKSLVWEKYCELHWERKSQPQNPSLICKNNLGKVDSEAMFVVMEKFSVKTPQVEGDESVEDAMVDALVAASGDEHWRSQAQKLVADELSFVPDVSLNLTALLVGEKVGKGFQNASPTQQSAVEKFLTFLDEGGTLELTDAEREALDSGKRTKFAANVKPGFLSRVTTYCGSLVHLKAIFNLITPILALRGAKFAVSDTLDEQHSRLIEEVARILGMELGVDSDEE